MFSFCFELTNVNSKWVIDFPVLVEVLRSPTLRTELLLFDVTNSAQKSVENSWTATAQPRKTEARNVPLDTAKIVLASLQSMQATDIHRHPQTVKVLRKFTSADYESQPVWLQFFYANEVRFEGFGGWVQVTKSRDLGIWMAIGYRFEGYAIDGAFDSASALPLLVQRCPGSLQSFVAGGESGTQIELCKCREFSVWGDLSRSSPMNLGCFTFTFSLHLSWDISTMLKCVDRRRLTTRGLVSLFFRSWQFCGFNKFERISLDLDTFFDCFVFWCLNLPGKNRNKVTPPHITKTLLCHDVSPSNLGWVKLRLVAVVFCCRDCVKSWLQIIWWTKKRIIWV